MSRYVHLELPATTLDQVAAALERLGLPYVRPARRVRLRGSLECTGDPVDLRLDAGVCEAVEDFGFVLHEGRVRLVCGELDQTQLESVLLPELRQETALAATERAAVAQGMRVTSTQVEAGGTRRLILEVDDEP